MLYIIILCFSKNFYSNCLTNFTSPPVTKPQIFPKSVKNIGLKNLFQLNSHFYTLKLSWHTEKSAVNLKSVYTGGLTLTET